MNRINQSYNICTGELGECMSEPIIYFIIPCFNEEQVLPVTSKLFLQKLLQLIHNHEISNESRLLFVNDGSHDDTWKIIQSLCHMSNHVLGISQSCNRGHQSSLLAGLMEVKEKCDAAISMDCDGQDDISVVSEMIQKYKDGADVVYGVRNDRKNDRLFKRLSAQMYYHLLRKMDDQMIYNHADFRLTSSRVLQVLSDYHEVNLYLRGLFPLIGFQSDICYYERKERIKGSTHYPLSKMIELALDGMFNVGVKPLRWISYLGGCMILFTVCIFAWIIIAKLTNHTVQGWASMLGILSFFSGLQMISTGIISEYLGRIYLEVKRRPRYVISERCGLDYEKKDLSK